MNNNSQKRKKQSRQDLYVTLIVILMMVAVIVAISVSLAKSSKQIEELSNDTDEVEDVVVKDPDDETDDVPAVDTEDVFLKDDETKDAETEKKPEPDGEETEKTDADKKEEVSVIPDFIAPVRGELLKGCSLEVPVFSLTMEDYRTHSGIDIYCDPGSDVAVVARGTVKEIWDDPMMGMCISVEHTGGAVSVYKNLCDDIPDGIEVGTKLEPGQIIATSGDTSLIELAEESHLHFELYIGGEAVDPCEYIEMKNEE